MRERDSWKFVLVAAFGLCASVALAEGSTPALPAGLLQDHSAADVARLTHTRWCAHPLGFATQKPCGRVEQVTLGVGRMKSPAVASLLRALDVERHWLDRDSLGSTGWVPLAGDSSSISVEFMTGDRLTMHVFLAERIVAISDTSGAQGVIDCSERADTLLALLRAALPNDATLRNEALPAFAGRSSFATHGRPPFGAIPIVDRMPEAVFEAPPDYPDDARAQNVSGKVWIAALIDGLGQVAETRVLTSEPLLEPAAERAVEQWRFAPAMRRGRPQPVWVTIPVKFTLH